MLKQFQLQKAQDLIAVELKPVNSTFSAKSLDLSPGSPSLKIGRQTSPKQPPTAQNGIFDSKVLSRQHAELWLNGDDGRVCASFLFFMFLGDFDSCMRRCCSGLYQRCGK